MDTLITGGTGSFGNAFVRAWLCDKSQSGRVIIYSRDEAKQWMMQSTLATELPSQSSRARFFLGDVRDRDRLRRALSGVQTVIHAAALKQVPALEYNPTEAVKTNILGSLNLIDAAIDTGVERVVALSSDKCCAPTNLYGASKMVMEKVLTQANVYSPKTRFACVRYGNVLGSRGSVIPLWREQAKSSVITITEPGMTRFFFTLEQAVAFVQWTLRQMQGGEVFVPKLQSVTLDDLAQVIAPSAKREMIGIRPGEKRHELLISSDEAQRVRDAERAYIIYPTQREWAGEERGELMPEGWEFGSQTAPRLSIEELRRWLTALQ